MSLFESLAFYSQESISMESLTVEREYEIYLEGVDVDSIVSRSSSNEHQEQWGIFVPKEDGNAATGSVRVRMTTVDGTDPKFVQTIKVKGGDGNPEKESPSDQEAFNMFAMLATQGLIKTRYNVPHTLSNGYEATFQFDVFYNKAGRQVPWVKLDVELPAGVTLEESDIDFTYSKMILLPPDKTTVDKSILDTVGEIYNTYFRAPNKYISE